MPVIGGVRQEGGLGTANYTNQLFDDPPSNWFQLEYNTVLSDAVSQYPNSFTEHSPTILAKLMWREACVNSSIQPTTSQARDPNWSGYTWNRSGSPGAGLVYDGVTAALNSSLVNNGAGNAKLAIMVQLSATANHFVIPVWMRSNSSLSWVESNNSSWHIRHDNPVAVQHAADFMHAFLQKFGNNLGIHSVQMAEYFFREPPSGFNRDAAIAGARDLWVSARNSAPVTNGSRVNIIQSGPIFNGTITINTLENDNVGITLSDTWLQRPLSGAINELQNMAALYNNGNVHVMHNGNLFYAANNRNATWDNQSNPFGHNSSYQAPATPQELLWYYSENGDVPCNSIFLTIAEYTIQNKANYLNALQQGYGPASLANLGAGSSTTTGTATITGAPVSGVQLGYSHNLSNASGAVVITGQQWSRNSLFGWAGANFQLTDAHEGETIGLRVFFTVNGVAAYKDAASIGPVGSAAFSLNPVGNKQVLEGNLLNFVVSASDPAAILSISGQPSGSSWTAGTGRFIWTPTTAGTYPVTFTATRGVDSDFEAINIVVSPYVASSDVVWQQPVKIDHMVSRIMYRPNGDKFGFGAQGLIIFQANGASTWSTLNQDGSGEWGQPHVMDDGTRYIMYSSNGTQVRVQVWTY